MPTDEAPPRFRQYPSVELLSLYRTGGYHPVNLNDVLHDRYRVIHKLGYGSYATVWLVEDLTSKRYASLKILTANASTGPNAEITILRHLRDQEKTPGSEYVLQLLDDFTIDGPNGTHQCIVTELLATSLGCLGTDIEELFENDRFPNDICKPMINQIPRGVAFLHKAGIVHRDLHLGNILLYHPDMEGWNLQDAYKYLGKPQGYPLIPENNLPLSAAVKSHLPQHVFPVPDPIPLLRLCLSTPKTVHVKICDFGEAVILQTAQHLELRHNTPVVYRAPEQLLEGPLPPSFSTDIWALAVLLHMILSGGSTLFASYHGIQKEVLREMVLTIGKFPEKWWSLWKEKGEYFDENMNLIAPSGSLPPISGTFLKVYPGNELDAEDVKAFEVLLRRMVVYEPKDRISADEVVRSIPAGWTQ